MKRENFFGNFLKQSEYGISLIQVLMASTAIAGLALVGLQLAKDQKLLAERTYQTYLIEYFTQEVTHLLYNKKVCKETMSGLSPKKATLEAIREPTSSPEGEELIRLYFGSKESGLASGTLFNGEYNISKYALNGDHPEASLAKNVTVLEIFLNQVDKPEAIKRSIPLSYSLDEQGNISDCSARIIVGEGPAEGFWKRKGSGLHLPNLSAMLGDVSNRNSGMALEGKIKLIPSETPVNCGKKSEGLLVYNSEGKLLYCHNESWLPVGYNVFNWLGAKKYLLTQNKYGTVDQEIGPHRYCYFVRQSFNTDSDKCSLNRETEQQLSLYKIVASTQSNVTNLSCEVTCVD